MVDALTHLGGQRFEPPFDPLYSVGIIRLHETALMGPLV